MTDYVDAPAAAPTAMTATRAEPAADTVPDGPGAIATAEAVALSTLQGSTAEKIDQLHHEMFAGTALGHHTELWNLVASFKERVKVLAAANT
ncbi:hypothetical protein ACQVP2_22320 [Methylobacterium aquaticum]|uniref:hypothetical protein n=1 Tax=Methylobacterium aquaticum TaxID=270351 RepID=UPI003D171119